MKKNGFTLVEVMISVFIIGAIFMLGSTLWRMFNNTSRQRMLGEAQEATQTVLYGITREVRNCKQVIFLSSDTLRFETFHFGRYGYDSNELVTMEIGTVTYTYREDGNNRQIERRVEFNNGSEGHTKTFLRNIIGPPTNTIPIFHAVTESSSTIDVALTIDFPMLKGAVHTYRTQISVRALGGQ